MNGAPAIHRRPVDWLPTGVLFADAAGRVVHANPRAGEILGEPVARLVGRGLEELFAPLDELLRRNAAAAALGAELPSRDGGPATIGFRLAEIPPNESDDGSRYAIVFQELSGIQRLRDERDRLLQIAAVGEVLPAVLHEIKNPLAGITTAVEVLLEELPEGHARRELVAVLSEVRRIKLTLEGIGLFRYQVRSARRAPVHKALREALLVIEPQARAKGVRLVPAIADLPPLPMDAAVMRAFLFNLATNAIHACGQGSEIRVSLRLVGDGAWLELAVADTGSGMPPEVLAHCREMFFTTKSNGSGIGLALCARSAEQSGGCMEIASLEGRGTTVTVLLPARPEGAAAAPKPEGGSECRASKS